jgi:hypothetical protein
MSYVDPDYPTKKAFLEAVKRGVKHYPYNPGLGMPVHDGSNSVEGPHYPKPHKWYAAVIIKNGVIVEAR